MQRRSLLSAGSLRWKCCLTNGMYNCRTRQPPLSGVVSSRSSERLTCIVSLSLRVCKVQTGIQYSYRSDDACAAPPELKRSRFWLIAAPPMMALLPKRVQDPRH